MATWLDDPASPPGTAPLRKEHVGDASVIHQLGRGVIVSGSVGPPDAWEECRRVRVDEAVLSGVERQAAIDQLHEAWVTRTPVVVQLEVDPQALQVAETNDAPPHEIGGDFLFPIERLAFLVWANNYDARDGAPRWWWAAKAARLWGGTEGGPADVVLPDGTPCFIDGGPRRPFDLPHPVRHRESVALAEATGRPFRAAQTRGGPVENELAPDQQRAVAHPGGPARVIAPAGSGKTRVLTERLRHLIIERGIEDRLVTALAYNNRAAAEMQERLGGIGRRVQTIHAYGLSLVSRAARSAGRDVKVIDDLEARALVQEIASPRPQANTDVVAPYLEALSQVRTGLVAPEAVETDRGDVPGFASTFRQYRRVLRDRGLVDFGDMVYGAVEALLADAALRAEAQRECTHLLVDEFQDLTPAYLLLIRLVAAPNLEVFGVGDDDQVIYSFGGADPGFLLDYADYFPGAAPYQLEVNYRCPEPVVAAASTMLGYNRRRVPKSIRPGPDAVPDPDSLTVVDLERTSPVVAVADAVEHAVSEVGPTGVAVLARVNRALLPVQIVLGQRGIPYREGVGVSALNYSGAATALAYLRLATVDDGRLDPGDLNQAVRRPPRGLNKAFGEALRRRRHWSLDDLGEATGRLSGRAERSATEFVDEIAALREFDAGGAPTTRLLEYLRDDVGLGRALESLDRTRAPDQGGNSDDLYALIAVAEFEERPARFEAWLRERLATGDHPDGVLLSSVHRVKGLEWPHVVVFDVSKDSFPHRRAGDVEEERRVFHVAITRAQRRCVVVPGVEASPFIRELTTPAPPVRDEPPESEASAVRRRKDSSRRKPTVAAELGLELRWGGYTGEVIELDDEHCRIRLDGAAKMRIPYGDEVTVDGRTVTLAGPGQGSSGRGGSRRSTSDIDADDPLLVALRDWRLSRASADGVPAYVVAHDRHLDAIADAQPTSAAELLACHGWGETKVERYGEEILDIVDAHLGG